MSKYEDFIKSKQIMTECSGFNIDVSKLNPQAFPWQRDIVRWSLKKGKAALFEDCGLGKTLQQLMFAEQVVQHTGCPVLILAPLAVAAQTKREGQKFGIEVNVCRDQGDICLGINIANYDIADKFIPDAFAGVILDESSILKHHSSKTRAYLTEAFKNTPYKLCCTATPAPNDFMELGNHAEFLGIMSRQEMLATFFVHDGGDTAKWRLKGHAEAEFFAWVASWACCMTSPADLGHDDEGFALPSLQIKEHIVQSDDLMDQRGQLLLWPSVSQNLMERRQARRNSLPARVEKAAEVVNEYSGQSLVWCDLNDESALLAKLIAGSVEVKGKDHAEHKTKAMMGFAEGDVHCLVSKPSIAGWGMNWQNCHNVVFVGLSDSFESYYQAIRRCWRFGQQHPVTVHIVISEAEGAVKLNIERKQADAQRMTRELVRHTKDILKADIQATVRVRDDYVARENMIVPSWLREVS